MNKDIAQLKDTARVGSESSAQDSIKWKAGIILEKYWADDLKKPYEVIERQGNLLTTAGLGRISSLIIGAGGQALTNTACRLGVGNSATAAAVGQTDLQASPGGSNRQINVMEATFPTQSSGLMTFKSSYATGEANFAWQEWCVDVGTPTVASGTLISALMINRKVESLGTKTSAGVWVLTATITLS